MLLKLHKGTGIIKLVKTIKLIYLYLQIIKPNNKMSDLEEIFSFGEDKVKNFIIREMGILKKFKTSFNYLSTSLKTQKLKKDLNKMVWSEGKNYDWLLIKQDTVEIIIRKYQNHFTFFCKNTLPTKFDDWKDIRYSCFTFNTNRDLLSDKDSDARVDNWFYDLNNHITRLIDVIKENGTHWLWNSVSYPRENFIELKQALDDESIYSLDLLVFACDELFEKHFEMYAQTETLKQLNQFKVGEIFKKDFHGDVKIEYIETEVKNDYYHAVGLGLINAKGEKKFEDVYSLTRWSFNDMFK